MANPRELAILVKNHRKAAKLSQLQLAEMAGVGKTVVFEIEKGKETVKLDTLRKILKVLNIDMRFISPIPENRNIDHEKS